MVLFLFALGTFFTYGSPSYAAWSHSFDMTENICIGQSIAYKARLSNSYSQFENWTDEKISIQITYGIPSQNFQHPQVQSSSIITLSPHSLRIFSPNEENFQDYSVYTVNANNFSVFDSSEWASNLGRFYIRHFNFVKNLPTQPLEKISSFNINLNQCINFHNRKLGPCIEEIKSNKT